MRAGHPNEGELEWANGRVSPEPKQLRVGWLLAVGCWLMAAGCWLLYMRVILFLQGPVSKVKSNRGERQG